MLKRIGFNILSLLKTGDGAFNMLSAGIIQYTGGFILFIVIIIGWIFLNKKYSSYHFEKPTTKPSLLYIILFPLIVTGFTVIGIRGGFQLRPISVINAIEGDQPNNAQLIMNSPFCFIQSITLPSVHEKKYMSDAEARKIFLNEYAAAGQKTANKKNVCIIIVESLSWKALAMGGNTEKSAKFIDSLAQYCTVYHRMYANGKQSIDGIPAILSGFPGLMDEPYLTSTYASNHMQSVASILKPIGYHSSFFHGGKKGTMNFDNYAEAVGFDLYSSKEDFPDPDQYDGNWGIWDKPYLQYYADHLNHIQQPFVSTVFTLSSHPPYSIPDAEKDIYNKSKSPFLNTISYTDDAIRLFFDKIKNTSWYSNTLFVLVADHVGELGADQGRKELYHIPFIIFDPAQPIYKEVNHLCQQTDILPILFERLGVNQRIKCWGNYRREPGFSISYLGSSYQLIMGNSVLVSDGETVLNYYNDTTHLPNYSPNEMLQFTRAFIQQYNNGLIENQLVLK